FEHVGGSQGPFRIAQKLLEAASASGFSRREIEAATKELEGAARVGKMPEPNFTEAPERRPALGLRSELDLVGEHLGQLGTMLTALEQRAHARVRVARRAVASDITLPHAERFLGVRRGRTAQLCAPQRERLSGSGVRLARGSAFEHLAQADAIVRRFVET